MLLSYVLDAGNNRHNMDTLSELHLGHKTISYKDVVGTGKKQLNFSEVNLEEATKKINFRVKNIDKNKKPTNGRYSI